MQCFFDGTFFTQLCKINLRHAVSLLVLGIHTGTFLLLKKQRINVRLCNVSIKVICNKIIFHSFTTTLFRHFLNCKCCSKYIRFVPILDGLISVVTYSAVYDVLVKSWLEQRLPRHIRILIILIVTYSRLTTTNRGDHLLNYSNN